MLAKAGGAVAPRYYSTTCSESHVNTPYSLTYDVIEIAIDALEWG